MLRAAADGDAQAAKDLLADGADVNCTNQAGQTALMLASLMGHAQLVPVLLVAGADRFIRDSHGLTALEWAQRRGFQEIIELLSGAPPAVEVPAAPPSGEESNEPARLRPQTLGPATMAVLKTVHASLEAQRQRAGAATQMAPGPSLSNAPEPTLSPVEEAVTSPHENGMSERERLFAAGFRKLEAQTRGKLDHDDGPMVHAAADAAPLVEAPPVQPPIVERSFADPLVSTRESVTAPLVSPASMSMAPDDFPAAVADSDTTLWLAPVLEKESPSTDETTVVAAEPVVPPSPPEPAAPKTSFLHTSVFDTQAPPESAPPSVVKPVLWVVIVFALLGSVYLTFVLTNRFMNRSATTSSNPAPATVTAASSASGSTVRAPSRFPLAEGALANAESELPDAEYPAKARSDSISGFVTVVVRVNRAGGEVIAARALNGNKLLRSAAEKAAKLAKFSPEKLTDESKVVSGIITYRFGNATVPNNVSDGDTPLVGGALTGAGLNVPKAEYPNQPNARKASGEVMVVARVNRFGEVIAAHALNGDSQLRAAAVAAASKARFSKEKLPTESLVTSGTITYYFKPSPAAPATATANVAPTPNPTPVATAPSAMPANDIPVVGGDLAGKEKSIPKAEYPREARSKRVSGIVTILVRVNKNGKVISWRTLSGDQLLRQAALTAARKATFSPEKLRDIDTILGTITYNFRP